MSNAKPRRVKAKITRTVTEIAIVLLDRDGNVEEVEEVLEELDTHESNVDIIHDIRTVHP